MKNEIDEIAIPILVEVLTEAQGQWGDPKSKYRDYRNLQIDKRGSFGERFFGDVLFKIYRRRITIIYNDGDQGDWDLKVNDTKFEIKTSSIDVNKKFQNEGIKEDADYEGVRVTLAGLLGRTRVHMQIDIGFADAVTPSPVDVLYPTILDFPAPTLHGYPRETLIAEKFQAMVALGEINSRMKDFYDIYTLATQFDFDGLSMTIRNGLGDN